MIEIGSALDPGRKRIATPNQDALCVIRPSLLHWHPPLLVLADGMGGYEGGSEASQLVVHSFCEIFQRSKLDVEPLQVLQAGVDASVRALRLLAEQQPNLARMGSTVVAAMLTGDSIYLLNVGDSRAYLCNAAAMRQISYDHSLVGDQLRQGLITEAQVRLHPRRNVLSMSLSAQRQQVETYTAVVDWQPGDSLVLCSDGLWGPVTESEIQSLVLQFPPQQAAEKLVHLANAKLGPDNISVIVAQYAG